MKQPYTIMICMGLIFTATSYTQAHPPIPAMDGQMVRLNANHLWTPIPLNPLTISQSEQIASDLHYPSISPNGDQILLFEPGDSGNPNHLHLWTKTIRTTREVAADHEVSGYITWQDDQTYAMREHSKPFVREAAQRVYELTPKKLPVLRNRKPMAASQIMAYDAGDVVVLENARNQTLQAISDTRHDRYYAPIVSPDERYIVFSGLTTGVHLFDIAQNAVVYIGASGTSPSFSPDGRYLIYAQTTDNGHEFTSGELVIIDLEKHTSRLIANPHHEIRLRGSISRNARTIAYETENGQIIRGTLDF